MEVSLSEYHQYTSALADASVSDEDKLKYAQEISHNFETISLSPQYGSFLEFLIPKIISVLEETEPQFSTDSTKQELRKLLLEIIHRIPANDNLKPHVSDILNEMFKILTVDNEENVLVCLRIIIELHKQFRPPIKPEIKMFLQFVINFYKEFPNNAKAHFDIVAVSSTGHLPPDPNGQTQSCPGTPSVKSTPASSPVGQPGDGSATPGRGSTSTQQTTVIPKATQSLKVLAELPIIVVLMYQLFKQNVQGKISEFIPVVMNTITLQPSHACRKSSSFNREMFVDFTAAQIKTLSFLAYIVRIFQELVGQYAGNLVAGMLALFRYCPQEVAHLRKELLIAARHILATELRGKFVSHIDQLFDEDVLIGNGWTVNEALRPLAYSTLADFVHHVRQSLPLQNLSIAVQLFSKNVYDESLPLSIQRMSCKLLLNLVECIRQRGDEAAGRELLMKMLEVFVRKFQTIAKHHIPAIMQKCEPARDPQLDKKAKDTTLSSTIFSASTSEKKVDEQKSEVKEETDELDTSKKLGINSKDSKDGFSVPDYREMVKTLVCGVKTITWGAGSCKLPGDVTIPVYPQGNKVFLPSETEIFIRLLKYALVALDVYQISVNPNGSGYLKMTNSPQQIRMKEEKEILEHFAGVFTMLNTATFKEVFSATIEYLVERIHNNYAFQIIPNSFLANPNTSATFATILVNFLLGRLKDMGTKSEQANLYLKLFKLVFGSVSLFAQENELMLKPHLHDIVNNSMSLALTAKEPYNYFLLLRALFRSIGGGNHDLLYQEFLPLLPTLLQGLNNLQNGIHKQYMKDLFVELCLTVPVRLSSLLPYLPMLMDPLVSALNGSQSLVSQGLRTLELCVDNLQPDFLYDHIQPVKSDLMQALWKTLRNPMETMAHVAFRVLGKFGGGGRKMLQQPQQLTYRINENIGPCLIVHFSETSTPVTFPIAVVIDKAYGLLKAQVPALPNSSSQQSNYTVDNMPFYREQAWMITKHYIVSAMSLEDSKAFFDVLFQHECYSKNEVTKPGKSNIPPCVDDQSKKTFQQGLASMLFAVSVKDLQEDSLPFTFGILQQFAMLAVVQQAGDFSLPRLEQVSGMDIHIIIDAIADLMSHEDKELCKYGHLAISVLYETVCIIMKDPLKAIRLPFFEYLAEKMCGCCYERAWFEKSGGCSAIEFMMNNMPLLWVIEHQPIFISALMFVMMDLTNEVSSGAVESAKTILCDLLKKCNSNSSEDVSDEFKTSKEQYFAIVVQSMVREVVSPNDTVREQARKCLQVLSDVTGKDVYSLMEPHKALLEEMIPPKKHLLRHQPVNTQIALMDGNTFCTSLSPRLFTMDLSIVEHKVFFTELYTLCEADDTTLTKLPCYKSVTSFSKLRVSALAALTSCHYIVQAREKIFNVLVKAINSSCPEVMKAGKENMQKFIAGGALESVKDLVSVNIRPLLLMLGDYRSLNMSVLQKLTCFMELFPELFNEKLCEQLLAHLRRWMDTAISTFSTQSQQQVKPAVRSTEEIKICTAIMNMFHLVPAASTKLIDPFMTLVVKTERALVLEIGSPFRKPLIEFLLLYPQATVDFFLTNMADALINRLFISILKRSDTGLLRNALESSSVKIVNSAFTPVQPQHEEHSIFQVKKETLQFNGILVIRTIIKHNKEWLSQQPVLISHLRKIWNNHVLFDRSKKPDINCNDHWRELKILAKCLLSYVQHKPEEMDLLFMLLKVYVVRSIPSFHFLKKFLQKISNEYTVKQKRNVFFKFVEYFHEQTVEQDLKGMILQHLIMPMFEASFKKGETDDLIGGPPNPEQDSPNNVISVFVNSVIDPEFPFKNADSVRILLLQFSALLVEHAGPHIHDVANRKQGNKLKRLYIYAWPCLLSKQCVDPATKYHGFYLQAHIIIKFAIHKKFVLQVFHGLLKAHGQEARTVVRQGLDILTPVLPTRMDDGYAMLSHWTKKIIVEEGHTLSQLVHVLHLLVRHHKIYYFVRFDLVQHMINSMQRLGFTQNATIEHRKLAVDLAEVIVEWEKQRYKDEQSSNVTAEDILNAGTKRSLSESNDALHSKRPRINGNTDNMEAAKGSFEKAIFDAVCNFLFRIACQVNEQSPTGNSPGETLSRRCFKLLQVTLKPYCWPDAELRVSWIDKLFAMAEQSANANFANISMALEILTYLCTIRNKHELLTMFQPLQRGIIACMNCSNTKVVKNVHTLLQKLLAIFPIETGAHGNKVEELEVLYNSIASAIYDGLVSYEKSSSTGTSLYGPVMLLKAASATSPTYLDKFLIQFMKAIQKMQKDHVSGQANENSNNLTDILITALELAKTRLAGMHGDMRKVFLTILTTLIEKSPDAKLLKAMVKMADSWVKCKMTANNQSNVPTTREKSLLLYRMMLNFEKRFAEDVELHAQFLDIINYVYRDKTVSGSELTARLEPAFLTGLRSVNPNIRSKFMEIFDKSMKRKLYDRLMYIFAVQNWEPMASHYWIKQCLELLLNIVQPDRKIICSSTHSRLTSCKATLQASKKKDASILLNKYKEKKIFDISAVKVKTEPEDMTENSTSSTSSANMDTDNADVFVPNFYIFCKDSKEILDKIQKEKSVKISISPVEDFDELFSKLTTKQGEFLSNLASTNIGPFMHALGQFSHRSTILAHRLWVEVFPRIWDLLEEKQHTILSGELGPFLCSGSHLAQTDGYRSVVNTLVEGMSRCTPPIPIRPITLKYLGKTHNLWHQSALMLENMAISCDDMVSVNPQLPHQQPWLDFGTYDDDVTEIPIQETFDSLASLYELLSEDDMCTGLWQRKSRFQETMTALNFEQQGLFELAQQGYEAAMSKARDQGNSGRLDPRLHSEYELWEEHWIRCAKELGQWDILIEFGKTKEQSNSSIVLESAWRIPDWNVMKDALTQVEVSYPESIAYQLTLYRGYLTICHPEEQNLTNVEKLVETASTQAIRQWRKLPQIVSSIHSGILRAAQQIIELSEAAQLHVGLQQQNIGRISSIHDMKATVKTWRNRLPLQCDDLVHWSDIFMWRHHHYQAIVASYENLSSQMSNETQSNNHAMLGVHASAWSIIYYGYIARKHGLTGVCLDSLSRIHTIPSVPIVDCFQKIRQQVKCYLQMSGIMGQSELQEGLEVIESTNLRYFTKEMTAEFFALKGMFLAQVSRSQDANKAFSEAVQMHDTLVKAWALWGDYLETLFVNERNITLGVYALICYLHACRSNHEAKCRKYLARSLWLLTYDDDKSTLAVTLEKYCIGVHPAHWLPWIPQLLSCLVRKEDLRVLSLIFSIGRVFPQAVYFPIRTLYLTLKIEQREKYKLGLVHGNKSGQAQSSKTEDGREKNESVKSEATESTSKTTVDSINECPTPVTLASKMSSENASTKQGNPKLLQQTSNTSVNGNTANIIDTSFTVDTNVSSSVNPTTASATITNTTTATTQAQTSNSQGNETGGLIRAPPQMWRCSRIMHMLRDLHPTLLSALEGIVDQMVWFRECWHEDVLRQLRQGLAKCYQVAFEHRGDINNAQVTPRTLSFVKKLVSTFGIGFESASNVSQTFSSAASESLARRAQVTAQDPVFQKLKSQFSSDFEFSQPNSHRLHTLIKKLKKWIKILEAKAKVLPSSFLLEETCRFISNFSQSTAEVELPGEFLMPKATTHNAFYVRIAKFMPRVELVQRHNFSARRLTIRGHNGKLYPYLVVNDAWLTESRREERVLQLLRMLNHFFEKRKETSRRSLQFAIPRVVAVSPQMRLIEDNPSFISLSEIYKEGCKKRNLDPEQPIAIYYDKLAQIQTRGYMFNHQSLRDVLKEIQANVVPDTMLKEWASYTYSSANEYWTFRKKLTQQIALAGFVEFVLHLTRLGPEMINIARDCGNITFNNFKFDIDDVKGELDANRPVPFRLTPNIQEFITSVGINGVISHCMIAVARCLVQPQFSISSYFKAILKDEMIAWHKKKQDEQNPLTSTSQSEIDNELLISLVTNASNAMMTRLQNLAIFENAESKVTTLISAASNPDNTCRMDPAWYPWL